MFLSPASLKSLCVYPTVPGLRSIGTNIPHILVQVLTNCVYLER